MSAKKRGNKWKVRGNYGNILFRKIKRLEKVFNKIFEAGLNEDGTIDIDKIDLEKLGQMSRNIDYSIQVQLSNIHGVEDFEILEKLERTKVEQEKPVRELSEIQAQRKF